MKETENEKWIEQFQNVIAKPKTILILGLYFFLITPITIFAGTGVGIIMFATFFSILWLFPYWQPAFKITRLIGNKNRVSSTLEKHKLKYYHFISLGIKIVFLFYLYYVGIKILMEKGIESLIH
ncbi:MAG: hypothetical protein HZB50_16045 [Chloroflexi bacterium]|nr:hypothetical protein [Chloroflexota bacterium]